MEQLLKQVQETLAVTIAVQDRHARMLVDHQEWLEDNTKAIARHREFIQQHEALMQSIDEKLDRLAELILKGRGSNGHGE